MAPSPQIRKAWDMVDEAKKDIENLSVEQVKAELDAGTAIVVDIRDFRELYLRGKIPGAFHADRGMIEFWIDPASEYYREHVHARQALHPLLRRRWPLRAERPRR